MLPVDTGYKPQMQTMEVIFNFQVAALKKQKEIDESNFNNVFYLRQHIQNITISTCNQCI